MGFMIRFLMKILVDVDPRWSHNVLRATDSCAPRSAADQTAILQILEDTGIAEVLSLAIEDVHVGSNLGSVLALTLQRSHAPGEVPEDLLDLNFVDTLPELELETTAEQGEETFETAQPASVPWAQHTASAKREEVGALKAEHSPMEGHDGVDGTGSPTEQIDTVLGELDIIDRLAGKLAVEKM